MPCTPNSSLLDFPAGFHDDDAQRSEFVRRLLVAERGAVEPSGVPVTIPKVLVRFWDDADAVPSDVQGCLASWEPLREEGFEVLTFDDASATAYIERHFTPGHLEAFQRCCHPAMRSDLFRLCYILGSGGFYVDADDAMTEGDWRILYRNSALKLQPLVFDIPKQEMAVVEGFWNFHRPRPDRLYYVNNNPLVAPPGHPALERALERATSALLGAAAPLDIQATTGPGNLTAALAEHAHIRALAGLSPDYEMIREWDRVGETCWDLSYREDDRNWRNMDGL